MDNATPAYLQTNEKSSAPTSGTPAPKKHRLWLWILLGIVGLMIVGAVGIGFIVWGLFQAGTNVVSNLNNEFSYNFNVNLDNTNSTINGTTDTDWYSHSELVGDNENGYSFLIPDDWTLDSSDPVGTTGTLSNYAFVYTDDTYGETTNHFEFEQQPITDGSDVTLAGYSAEFVDSLNEGLTNGDFKLLNTDNRTVGLNSDPAFSVSLGNDTTGERNYYVLTVIDNVEYEFGVFYFQDQETQALADFEKVILTFEVK